MNIGDFVFIVNAIIFGGQYNTLSQIARLLVAIYLAYVGRSSRILGEGLKDFLSFVSLLYLMIVALASIMNTIEYIRM